jgi:hypothetical protein
MSMPIVDVFREIGGFALASMLASLLPLIAGAAYARRPSEYRLQLMRPLSLAALFSGLAGTTSGFVAGLRSVARTNGFSLATTHAIVAGASEALVPIFFAFGCLTVAWLLVTVGMTRSDVG